MLPSQTSSTTSRGVKVQNTAEEEEYRKRTVAIQRELRAVAVTLTANRRRFLRKRAELARRSPRSSSFGGTLAPPATETQKRDEGSGDASRTRALSAVLERPYNKDADQPASEKLDSSQQEVSEDGSMSREGSFKRRSTHSKKHRSEMSGSSDESAQETENQSHHAGRPRKSSDEKTEMKFSVQINVPESAGHTGRIRSNSYSSDEKTQSKSESSVTDTLLPNESNRTGVNRRTTSFLSPRSSTPTTDGATVKPAPPLKADDTHDSSVISRRMRSMTVGATEKLSLSRLRQVYDVRVGAHTPIEEQDCMENTQRRIKDFLERTGAESVVSDASDLASEAGSAVVTRISSERRRRTVSRVYSLEPSPRLRKRSVPVKLADSISEEDECKDKLKLPPLTLPPVHTNVPLKLLPRNYSKRGHYYQESTRLWTAEEWEELKQCRYLRIKSIP